MMLQNYCTADSYSCTAVGSFCLRMVLLAWASGIGMAARAAAHAPRSMGSPMGRPIIAWARTQYQRWTVVGRPATRRLAWVAVPGAAALPALLWYAQAGAATTHCEGDTMEIRLGGSVADVGAELRRVTASINSTRAAEFVKQGSLGDVFVVLMGEAAGPKVDALRLVKGLASHGLGTELCSSPCLKAVVQCVVPRGDAEVTSEALRTLCELASAKPESLGARPDVIDAAIQCVGGGASAGSAHNSSSWMPWGGGGKPDLANVSSTSAAVPLITPEVAYEAVRLIDTLAHETSAHRALIKAGVLEPLAQMTAAATPQTRSRAANALVSLAATTDDRASVIHRRMADAGSFAVIVEQLADRNATVAALAAKGVEKLARGGGEPLKQLLQLEAIASLNKLVFQLSDGSHTTKEVRDVVL